MIEWRHAGSETVVGQVDPRKLRGFLKKAVVQENMEAIVVLKNGLIHEVCTAGSIKSVSFWEAIKLRFGMGPTIHAYFIDITPRTLEFWLEDPAHTIERTTGHLFGMPALTKDGQLISAQVNLTISVDADEPDMLIRSLHGKTLLTVDDLRLLVRDEFLGKALAPALRRKTAAELRSDQSLLRQLYEELKIQLNDTFSGYGLKLDTSQFFINWGLTQDEKESIDRNLRQAEIEFAKHQADLKSIPATIPGPPTNATATAGNAQATVIWNAPSSTGGSQITSYNVTASPDGQTMTVDGQALTTTFNALTNGMSYTFTIVATNSVGDGIASAQSSAVTPATIPGASTNVYATSGNAQATVTWSAPSSTGGSSITSYNVTASPGGQAMTVGGSTLTTTFTSLSNGTSYTFAVVAANTVGTSESSSTSNSVTPATIPSVPTNVTATAGNTQAAVTWNAPSSTGGSSITSYSVTANPGGQTITVDGSTLTATFTSLNNGTSYTFAVVSANTVGTSTSSSTSNTVTPATVPGAATNVYATSGNTQASVTWTAPSSAGGSTITGYDVTASPGGQTVTVGGSTLTAIFTSLTNGTSYTFIVTTINTIGTGASSSTSNSVTPATVPGTPTNVFATSNNTQASVTWSAPLSTGGSPINSYNVTASPGGQAVTVDGQTLTATFNALNNGTSYTFTVVTTNSAGNGIASAPSSAVTTATVPGVATNATATAGNTQATMSPNVPERDSATPSSGIFIGRVGSVGRDFKVSESNGLDGKWITLLMGVVLAGIVGLVYVLSQ